MVRNVAGSWSASLSKAQDDCAALKSPAKKTMTNAVNQRDDAITVSDEDRIEYIGSTVGNDGFSADSDSDIPVDNKRCDLDTRIQYTDVTSDSDTTATVTLKFLITCADGTSCQAVYNGHATRGSTVRD